MNCRSTHPCVVMDYQSLMLGSFWCSSMPLTVRAVPQTYLGCSIDLVRITSIPTCRASRPISFGVSEMLGMRPHLVKLVLAQVY